MDFIRYNKYSVLNIQKQKPKQLAEFHVPPGSLNKSGLFSNVNMKSLRKTESELHENNIRNS